MKIYIGAYLIKPINCLTIILIVSNVFTSCTVLQWRKNDIEIKKEFKGLDIPSRISYYKVDSLNLKLRTQHIERKGNSINLLFLHGSPSSLSAWDSYLKNDTLLAIANIHAIDRPGYGYSSFGKAIPDIDEQARILNGLIQDYKLKNVITVGSSYGGPVAARLAVLNPNVKAVVMISPAIDPENEKKIWASRLTQWWLTRWLAPTGYRVAGDEKTVHAQELAEIEKDWSKVTVPVLHIHGDIDAIVPYENTAYTKTVFKDIKIITTPQTGHEIAWARPELIVPHLMEMIENLQRSHTSIRIY